ncbi:MAG: DUF1330 domain-containing protein [Paracoccaceae bacterium]|nr:DUF1330 domain-containing protein [Paracoccaceae bacterium]MDE2911314.1 DUF1330 domain-containing protein [Paracoccaceae bacterium]
MAAYMIARIDVTNLEAYRTYAAETPRIAAMFGGRFLVKAGRFEQLEGSGPDRHVVVEFPDRERALDFYNSREYGEYLPIALQHSTRDVVIVDGIAE